MSVRSFQTISQALILPPKPFDPNLADHRGLNRILQLLALSTDMNGIDLTVWVGKPPERPNAPEQPQEAAEDIVEVTTSEPFEDEDAPGETSFAPEEQADLSASDESSDIGDIEHGDGTTKKRRRESYRPTAGEDISSNEEDEEEDEDLPASIGMFQKHLFVDVPKLSEEEKETYEYLPGHFSVERVLYRQKDNRYVVRLESGEQDIVSYSSPGMTFTSFTPEIELGCGRRSFLWPLFPRLPKCIFHSGLLSIFKAATTVSSTFSP